MPHPGGIELRNENPDGRRDRYGNQEPNGEPIGKEELEVECAHRVGHGAQIAALRCREEETKYQSREIKPKATKTNGTCEGMEVKKNSPAKAILP